MGGIDGASSFVPGIGGYSGCPLAGAVLCQSGNYYHGSYPPVVPPNPDLCGKVQLIDARYILY